MITKDKRWFDRNSFSNNQEYTENTLNKFNINKYHFIYDKWGNIALLIEQGLKKYRVEINEIKNSVEIYRCEVHTNFGKYTKENFKLKKSFNDDCIWNSIKWISKDSKII